MSLTPELRASTPTCYLLPGVPRGKKKTPQNSGTPSWWAHHHVTAGELRHRRREGACPGHIQVNKHPPNPPPPPRLASWCLHLAWVLATLLSPVSPLQPTAQGTVQEPGTYQDKEQKSWGKEAKSHLYSGVGPFSFAPLKFQIPVCGQSPNFLTI